MSKAVDNVGRALGQKETETILALYAGVLAADLATGAELAGGGAVASWASLLSLHEAIRREKWRPNVLAINEMQLHQLLNDDKFVKSVYLPSSETDIAQGTIGSVLGMTVQSSTLCLTERCMQLTLAWLQLCFFAETSLWKTGKKSKTAPTGFVEPQGLALAFSAPKLSLA
jgi:hypothetical protein